jgi:hypothetical protein
MSNVAQWMVPPLVIPGLLALVIAVAALVQQGPG